MLPSPSMLPRPTKRAFILAIALAVSALAGCTEPPPPAEPLVELGGLAVNGEARAVSRDAETVSAAGWSCEVRSGRFGVTARCGFAESDATVVAGVHCDSANTLSLGGAGGARLELSILCTRPDGTCVDNQFRPLGSAASVACPGRE